jgi:hypothetical protein
VKLPETWDDPATASKIDAKLGGPGIFEEYAQFNPNNESRIELAWSVAEVSAIFDKVAKEYHRMMEIYMKGTGGGPGADENFHNWMERDDTCVVTYLSGQHSNIYLSLVKMWARSYGYVFVKKKEQLPEDVCIGDTYSGRGDDDEGCVSSFTLVTTPRPTSMSVKTKIEKIWSNKQDLATARKESSENQREILALLKRDIDSSAEYNDGNMHDIEQTQRVIKNFEDDLNKHNANKSKLMDRIIDGMNDSKISKVENDIQEIKRMIKISKQQLKSKMVRMENAMKKSNKEEDSSSCNEDSD